MKTITAIAGLAGLAAAATAGDTFDITIDIDTFEGLGSILNQVEVVDLNAETGRTSGNQVIVTGIGWDP